MNKRVLAFIAAAIVLVAGFFILTKPKAPVEPSNHTFGDGKSGVILIEYGDFQCPACKGYHPILKAIKEKYKKEITFQFRNFPLKAIHANALAGARAAEAASLQGKFWEMHDRLFEGQDSWTSLSNPQPIFEGYATSLGLDLEKFKTDYASSSVHDVILADEKEAQKIDATSTPTFVLNGKKVEDNPRDQESFEKLISDAIKDKKSM